MYDSIIVGSGIAGMTAAIYLARGGAKVLVFDNNGFGGQIVEAECVKNYPGIDNINGYDLAKSIYDQMISNGVEVINEEVLKIEDKNTIVTNKNLYKTKTIIIANGVVKRKLGLYGEKELVGSGISYCATCDGAFFRGKDVAIVGAGNTAVEDAIYLSKIVNKLYFIHRNENFRCDNVLLEELKKLPNIEFKLNRSITSLNGESNLETIILDNEEELAINGLFISIGSIPNNIRFSNIVDLDENGYVISNDTTTNVENIFVCGDTRTKKLRQLVTASSDGAIAATNALNIIRK